MLFKLFLAIVIGFSCAVALFRVTQIHLSGLSQFLYWVASQNVVPTQDDFHTLTFYSHVLVFALFWFVVVIFSSRLLVRR